MRMHRTTPLLDGKHSSHPPVESHNVILSRLVTSGTIVQIRVMVTCVLWSPFR